MCNTDRIWPAWFDVPSHVIDRLTAAAEDELERAWDRGGEWGPEKRERLLRAARLVEAMQGTRPITPAQVIVLAERALELEFGDGIFAPDEKDDLIDFVGTFGTARELLDVRDAARAEAAKSSPSEPA